MGKRDPSRSRGCELYVADISECPGFGFSMNWITLESQSTPGIKMVDPQNHVKNGWDYPLLTFIYPGFDCGSLGPKSEIVATEKKTP